MGYRTFVEPGRVAFVNYGEDYGKVVVIVDIADASRDLVDGENVPRTLYPLRRLSLTKLKLDISRGLRTGGLLKKIKEFGLQAKWDSTPIAQKIARQRTRQNLTDFERFSVMINRKRRSTQAKQIAAKALGKSKVSKKKK
jgi:large subunit ribosomal protein L14e